MAFLGLKIPANVATSLGRLKVPGRLENQDHYHITMFSLGKQVPIEDLTHMVEVAHDVLAKANPFSLKLNHVTNFPAGKDGFPIICPVESDGLQKLRQDLKEAFDFESVEYANNFPDYKPHVTLAYSDKEIDERPFREVKWEADRVVLWGGDSGEDRLVVEFPFSSGSSKCAHMVATRYVLTYA
jgi:2'-5' RNA ligase